MSKPNVTVVIEPAEGTSVVYEPVARENANKKSAGLICLMLAITNNESKQIHLNKVTLSFAGPPAVPTATIPVPMNWWPPTGTGINIAPGATANWNFLRESVENDTVVLADVAPASMTLSLFFDGFTSPWSVTKNLAPHKNPVTGNAYLFPAQFDDLSPGEFWAAASNVHGTGATGSQLFAYDMNVLGWDDKKKAVNRLHPGKNGDHNEDYRVWGKKLHAMANGKVLQFVNDCPNNDPPLANQFNGTKVHDDNLWTTQMNSFWGAYDNAHGGEAVVHAGAGNHFYIQHGNEVALYAHMQKGTLNSKLLTPGAAVAAGDFLGLAGNSGNASEPHTHIHTIKGTQPEVGPLRPLLFRDMFAIDQADLKLPDISGPWARVNVQSPPLGPPNAFIWPLGRNPEWVGWQDLGGPILAPPAVSSWAAHRLDVFSSGPDGKLNHKWWDGSIWHNWQTLGGFFKGGPAAVSWGPNRIDVFVRGTDDHLGHLWWNGSTWKGWEGLGGNLTSAPAVASWGSNRLDVFAAGPDGNLKHKWWDGSTWHDWQNLGGVFKGAPSAVSWGPNRIDVFVRGTDDHLGHLWWNGSQWNGWQDLGGPVTSAPAVASWGSNRLDVFAAGPDGNLNHKWWDGTKWSDWDWVGGLFHDNPAAVSWGTKRIDVFVRGMDGKLGHLWRG
jgi:peptide methionine sulfoxide reductase MsrB